MTGKGMLCASSEAFFTVKHAMVLYCNGTSAATEQFVPAGHG